MNWKMKALLQGTFSLLPFGEPLNHFFQRHVTRSLPTSAAKCGGIVSVAKQHFDLLQRHGTRPLEDATFYEFGAGWDLMIPFALYCFGVDHQILVDIRQLVRVYLVNDAIAKLQRLAGSLRLPRVPQRYLGNDQTEALATLRDEYGIDYRAPVNARDTQMPEVSIDYITSTNTLEHIPAHDICAVLGECNRVLRDDGLMSVQIDYQDHYAYFDTRISVYNFLKYSDRAWSWLNPGLHYQNRLRHRDYLELFDVTGFEIVEDLRAEGAASDLAVLAELPLATRFHRYSPAELGIRHSLVLLRKRRDNGARR